jgi:Carboxypeptidase regulatory-like domain
MFAPLLLLLQLSAHPTESTSPLITLAITFVVHDPAGTPIPGASVQLRVTELASPAPIRSGITSSHGVVSFSGLPSGRYNVWVSLTGFLSVSLPGLPLFPASLLNTFAVANPERIVVVLNPTQIGCGPVTATGATPLHSGSQ